uniref:Major facilitator superfamily (MFS) profile domain-containing protein n=1 Tax=Cuerna arida TaxID=1464854 RepID=A0A1B6GD96_9HEMI
MEKLNFPGERGNLYFSVLAANLVSVSIGTHYSWTSPTLPKLEASDSFIHLSISEASWVGSLTAFGTLFGPFLGGFVMDKLGRRLTLLLAIVINLLAWAVLLIATSTWHIYVGRFLGGFAGGFVFVALPVYVAEIAEPQVRGPVGALFAFLLVGGYLIEFVFGPYVSYSTLICINCVPAVLFLLFFSFIPESPYYFIRKKDTAGAQKSLTWLRTDRSPQEVRKELTGIQEEVSKSMAEKARLTDLVRIRGNRKGLIISVCLLVGQQLSGINAILFYAQSIFIMSGTSLSSSVSTIICGIALFVVQGVAVPLTKPFGSKNLLIVSGAGMTVFQISLGVFFYFTNKGYDMSSYPWWPVISLVGFIILFSIGFGILPYTVMGEMFAPNVKGIGSAISAGSSWFTAFLLTLFFNDISDSLGPHFTFFILSIFCFLDFLFAVFVMPDTRGMTLQEILDLLNSQHGAIPKMQSDNEVAQSFLSESISSRTN